jgi:hypothetical protein
MSRDRLREMMGLRIFIRRNCTDFSLVKAGCVASRGGMLRPVSEVKIRGTRLVALVVPMRNSAMLERQKSKKIGENRLQERHGFVLLA